MSSCDSIKISAWQRACRCVAMTSLGHESADRPAYSPLFCMGLLLTIALLVNLGQ